jgi:hypothetical protein
VTGFDIITFKGSVLWPGDGRQHLVTAMCDSLRIDGLGDIADDNRIY